MVLFHDMQTSTCWGCAKEQCYLCPIEQFMSL